MWKGASAKNIDKNRKTEKVMKERQIDRQRQKEMEIERDRDRKRQNEIMGK